MKRTRNTNSNTVNTNNTNVKENTMKRTRNTNSNTVNTNTQAIDPSKLQALFTQFLATQGVASASEDVASDTSGDKANTREKAQPIFEMPTLKGNFKKALYAAPLSQDAVAYFNEMKSLCHDVRINLIDSELVREINAFAIKIEDNGSESVTDFALSLLSRYTIPMQSMRVILQLVCPVMCVCCTESDTLARKGYGLSRANALMGSACNECMYRVCREVKTPIPFKRVAYNFSALGLDFSPCDTVADCDFCCEDNDFTELVTLCQNWLDKCESKEQVKVATPKRTVKESVAQQNVIDATQLQNAFEAFLRTYKG